MMNNFGQCSDVPNFDWLNGSYSYTCQIKPMGCFKEVTFTRKHMKANHYFRIMSFPYHVIV